MRHTRNFDELLAGTESFTDRQSAEKYTRVAAQLHEDPFSRSTEMSETMGPPQGRPQRRHVFIRMADEHNYRIYMTSDMAFDTANLNLLCRFLDSRSREDTVTFILGANMDDYAWSYNVGSVIAAMRSCQANVRAIAAGYCSITETIIWSFACERDIYHYGALTIGIDDIVKWCPVYTAYFNAFLARAMVIGILTEQERDELLKTRRSIFLIYKDAHKRMAAVNNIK